MGVRFSEEAWQMGNPGDSVPLWRCGECGFEFCDPHLAGNESFYQELQQQKENYYPEGSQEFGRCLRFARGKGIKTVLDVGCGAGAFLDMAKGAGLQTFGVELNSKAAESARTKGHQIYDVLLSELIRRDSLPKFDLVTAWQVLEHVSTPVQFLREAARLVRPEGFLAVAVPNEEGIHRICPLNPHCWPPHHVTRWRLRDLKHLGKLLELEFVEGGGDVLYGASAEYLWNLHNELAGALGGKRYPGGRWVPGLLSQIYRKTGLRHFLPGYGESTFAFYRKTGG